MFTLRYLGLFLCVGWTLAAPASLMPPQALTVSCQSLGGGEDFKHRLKHRDDAEDQTTIWLFKGEQLSIQFNLSDAAVVDVLDVRYSNDGDWDTLSVSIDDHLLGTFKTENVFGWGKFWNAFKSSGPMGGHQYLSAGKHIITLNVLESDRYGVEIDYIRFNVHGAKLERLDKEDFMCTHKPGDKNMAIH